MLDERVKTDIRMPVAVHADLDELCHDLGLTKNAVFMLGMVDAMSRLIPLVKNKRKRKTMIKNIESMFQKIIDELKRSTR